MNGLYLFMCRAVLGVVLGSLAYGQATLPKTESGMAVMS
jgi:hypothetical protein